MKYIHIALSLMIYGSAFGQIEQNIHKASGTESNPINSIDSIRFTGGQTEMEIIFHNGSTEIHILSDIDNITFSGEIMYPPGTVHCGDPTVVADAINPITGKTWMDRNLGASQVASISEDTAAYGDLYQWGRRAEGHQCRTSAAHNGSTLGYPSTATQNGGWDGKFITTTTAPFDWLHQQQNPNLWQYVSGINNPCPKGYRVPTEAELDAERLSWISNNAAGAFASPLKLPLTGYRDGSNGSIIGDGSAGIYWSSTVSGTISSALAILNNTAQMVTNGRSRGNSVRCIKDDLPTQGLIDSLDCNSVVLSDSLVEGVSANGVTFQLSYYGGNGGPYNGQVVSSTGVTGLTAELTSGYLHVGNGTLTFGLSGTPGSSGVASFIIEAGGDTCTIDIVVNTGSVSSLDCVGATVNGDLVAGLVANGVTAELEYMGGNGGPHNGQTTNSTGVTGLSAELSAGSFASGNGTLIYSITGTPASDGIAIFAIDIGGETCALALMVELGIVTSLNCAGASINGTLLNGVAASGVSAEIAYSGGNGGSHNGQTIGSTGVTGLTASLTSGNFNIGNGVLTYSITGVPGSNGNASFAINIGGQTCVLEITTTVYCGPLNAPTVVVDVTNPTTGKIWMDRNLGAAQAATSSTDIDSYGDLYQWGRGTDGHQCRNSTTTTTLASSVKPGHGNFILSPSLPHDWRLFQHPIPWQGVNGINNPCPSGYRLPTEAEWDAERTSWSTNNAAGAFASPLKLPLAGSRNSNSGAVLYVGTSGDYWSSEVTTGGSFASGGLYFNSTTAQSSSGGYASGNSVRCIKD